MPIEIVIDTRQFRGLQGRFARYSEELRQTRLQPWASLLADEMEKVIHDLVPSRRVAQAFTRTISFETGPPGHGGGTRIRFFIPMEEWEELALLLLFGARPHLILPRRKKALMWFGAGEPKLHPEKTWFVPDHPLTMVRHPGFLGVDWVSKVEEETYQRGLLGPGSIANKFAKDAELKLTPTGAAAAGAARRLEFFELVGAMRNVLPPGLDPFIAADIVMRLREVF